MKKAQCLGAFGARGSGKTMWVRQQIRKMRPARLLVWDYKHDPKLKDIGRGFTSWPEFVRACSGRSFQARYLVSPDHDPHEQFEAFCQLAWRLGNLLMFVDELPEVTKANRAPPTWRKCVNVGREYDDGRKALSIIAAGQRMAEVDKSFLDNCDVIHCGRLGHADAKKMAQQWGLKVQDFTNLPDLAWIEKRADKSEVERGVLSLSSEKPPDSAKK